MDTVRLVGAESDFAVLHKVYNWMVNGIQFVPQSGLARIPMKTMLLELLISFIPVSSFMWGRRKGLERMKTPEPSHPNYTIGHETAPCQRISSWINSFTSLGFNACADHPV